MGEDARFEVKDIEMGVCPSCQRDTKELLNLALNWLLSEEKEMAEDYCEQHEDKYSNHKCKPHWCGDCGYIINYEIEVDVNATVQKGK
jgi:hypothetical protein